MTRALPARRSGKIPDSEREVTEMVGLEVQLESVHARVANGVAERDHARVEHQEVDGSPVGAEDVGASRHRAEVGEIEVDELESGIRHLRADARDDPLPFRPVAHRQHDLGAGLRQAAGDLGADPIARAGDHGPGAPQIGKADAPARRTRRVHTGSSLGEGGTGTGWVLVVTG